MEDGQTVQFTLYDSQTIESATGRQDEGNSVDRRDGQVVPMGSTYQRYIWTAPLKNLVFGLMIQMLETNQ
jgi:hypothetical protein